jgi:hypothetical protein
MKIGMLLLLVDLSMSSFVLAQSDSTCEVTMEQPFYSAQDSIVGTELGITKFGENFFNWDGVAAVVSLDSTHKKIYCMMMDFVLNEADTIEFRQVCIAHIYVNMHTCEVKKEIFAQNFLTKPVQKLLAEYPDYKRKMRGWSPKRKHPYENHLRRYTYDLTHVALLGDSLGIELLLSLNKDFKLFRTGLDLEDLMWNRNIVYELVIREKPKDYAKRYWILSRMWY